MRYDIEFGKWVREHPTDVSAIGINALLDELDRMTAEVEKHRWIPVSDMSKLEDGKCYQILTKENPIFPDCEFYSFENGWATDKEVTHYREISLPEPPKEDA